MIYIPMVPRALSTVEREGPAEEAATNVPRISPHLSEVKEEWLKGENLGTRDDKIL